MTELESAVSAAARDRPESAPALAIESLSKRYGGKLAVRDINLTLRPGSIHGLVGLNGSGKSTILRSILGLVHPDEGTITVLGGEREPAAARPVGGLAGLVDDPRFYPYLSATTNLHLLARLDGGPAPDVEALLRRAGLTGAGAEKVGGFSLGMRQRLGLAAALMRRPRVLLLDEPANGLDPAGADELWQVVRELAEEGVGILLASHDLVTIDDVCDELTVLGAGRVAWSGRIADLRALAPAPEHMLRTTHDDAAVELATRVGVHAGLEREGLRVVAARASLVAFTVELGRAGVGICSLTPGAPPLRVLFKRLTEGPLHDLPDPRPASNGDRDAAGTATREPGGRHGQAPGTARRDRPRGRGLRLSDVRAVMEVERTKLAAQMKPRVLLAACLLGPWLFMLAVKVAGSLPSDTLYGRWMLESSAALPLVALTFAASWIFALLGSLVGGDAFSSEDRHGTWPTLLTRSRPLSAIVAGKIAVSVICTVIFVVVLAVSASLAGLALAHHGPLPGLTGQLIPPAHAFRLVAAAWAASIPVALAWTAFALVLSARTRNSVIGVGVPAVVGILLQAVWLIDGPPLVRELVPSGALDAWHGLFQAPQQVNPLTTAVLVAVAWLIIGVIALWAVMRRRDAVAA